MQKLGGVAPSKLSEAIKSLSDLIEISVRPSPVEESSQAAKLRLDVTPQADP